MTPNFDDFSCEMVFGQVPPAFEDEEASRQSCLKHICPTASVTSQPCRKLT